MTSTVKKWFYDRGFGFIRDPDGGRDFFVHFSDCHTPAGKKLTCLNEGDTVEFDPAKGARGMIAVNVVLRDSQVGINARCETRNPKPETRNPSGGTPGQRHAAGTDCATP